MLVCLGIKKRCIVGYFNTLTCLLTAVLLQIPVQADTCNAEPA